MLSSDLFTKIEFIAAFNEQNDTNSEQFKQTVSEYLAFGAYLKSAPFTTKGFGLFTKGTGKKTGKKKKGKKGKRAESVPPKESPQSAKGPKAASDEENAPDGALPAPKKKKFGKRKPPMKF